MHRVYYITCYTMRSNGQGLDEFGWVVCEESVKAICRRTLRAWPLGYTAGPRQPPTAQASTHMAGTRPKSSTRRSEGAVQAAGDLQGDKSPIRRGANRDNVVSICLGECILHSVVCDLTSTPSSIAAYYYSSAQTQSPARLEL
jgi:hypothetical protein